jgi:uncharacterized membrane-anchored protein YhcB (DUF1043 family)
MINVLIFLVIFIAGGAIGFGIYHMTLGKKRNGEKEQELEQAKTELEQYKAKVNNHFMNSADLMGQVASSYQALHTHMATQSQSLLNEEDISPFPLLNTPSPQAQETPMLNKNTELEKEVAITPEESSKAAVDSNVKARDGEQVAFDGKQQAPASDEQLADNEDMAAGRDEKTSDSKETAPHSTEKSLNSSEKVATDNDNSVASRETADDNNEKVFNGGEPVASADKRTGH